MPAYGRHAQRSLTQGGVILEWELWIGECKGWASLSPIWNRAPNADEAATGMLVACEAISQGRVGAWRDARQGLVGLMTTVPGRPHNRICGLDGTATPRMQAHLQYDSLPAECPGPHGSGQAFPTKSMRR